MTYKDVNIIQVEAVRLHQQIIDIEKRNGLKDITFSADEVKTLKYVLKITAQLAENKLHDEIAELWRKDFESEV